MLKSHWKLFVCHFAVQTSFSELSVTQSTVWQQAKRKGILTCTQTAVTVTAVETGTQI